MSAVDFAHKRFELFENVELNANRSKKNRTILDAYSKVENEFKNHILDLIMVNFEDSFLKERSYFKSICCYEAEIALLKSISFPKIVYFRLIREIATVVIIKRIKDIVNGDSPKFIDKDASYQKFNIINILNEEERIELNNDINNVSFKEFHDYLKEFKNKNGVNYLNFLYRTAGYLNIAQILSEENIKFFYEMTKKLKENTKNFDDSHHLLHTYPFAVKMIISDLKNADRYKYFQKNLNNFKKSSQEFENSQYSMIHALLLESAINMQKEFEEKIYANESKEIGEKIEELSKFFEDKVRNEIKISNIYINENLNIEYGDGYKEYLVKSKLIDVKNNFDELSKDNKDIYMLYKGVLKVV